MEAIAKYLKDNGIEQVITIGSVVDSDGVGLFSTSGLSPTYYSDNTMDIYEGLQIIARNTSYRQCEKAINDIFNLLNSLEEFKAEQIPFYIGKDEKGRCEFSVNFIIMKEGVF